MNGLEKNQSPGGIHLEVHIESVHGSGKSRTPVRTETGVGNHDVQVCDAIFGLELFDSGESVSGREAIDFNDDEFRVCAGFERFEIRCGGIADSGDYGGVIQGEIMAGKAEPDTTICACDKVCEPRHCNVDCNGN